MGAAQLLFKIFIYLFIGLVYCPIALQALSGRFTIFFLIIQATHCPPQQAGYSFYRPRKDMLRGKSTVPHHGLCSFSWRLVGAGSGGEVYLYYTCLIVYTSCPIFAVLCCVYLNNQENSRLAPVPFSMPKSFAYSYHKHTRSNRLMSAP